MLCLRLRVDSSFPALLDWPLFGFSNADSPEGLKVPRDHWKLVPDLVALYRKGSPQERAFAVAFVRKHGRTWNGAEPHWRKLVELVNSSVKPWDLHPNNTSKRIESIVAMAIEAWYSIADNGEDL